MAVYATSVAGASGFAEAAAAHVPTSRRALAAPWWIASAAMDVEGYRRASREVWTAMAPGWDRRSAFFERVARPVTEGMLERLAPRAGDTVLDLATGAGAVGLDRGRRRRRRADGCS